MSKIWRELEADAYVRVSMRNLEDLSAEEPGIFEPLTQTDLGAPVAKASKVASGSEKGGSPSTSASIAAGSASAAQVASDDVAVIEERGYQRGLAAGKKQAEDKFEQVTKALTQATQKLSTQSESIMQRSAEDMLHLVMAIARRIIQVEISEHKETIVRIVQQAINAAVQAEEFHVKVNPEDLQELNEHKPLFLASLSGLSNIEFVSDGSITRGGCILESPSGRVDATLETQLDEIFAHLKETMVHSQ